MATLTRSITTEQTTEEAGPERKTPLPLLILTGFTGLLLVAAAYMTFVYAPMEITMGAVQKIFYFHVGAAWAGALAFLVTAGAGGVYLVTRSPIWDRVGLSAVEVGLALVTMTLLSGPVWAQYAWGQAWTWDPKLTSAAVMWLAYAAYLLLREGLEDPARRARFSAVYGILAFTSVIMTYFGVRFIEATIHPTVIGPSASTAQGDFGLSSAMLQTLLFCVFTFTFVFATAFWHRLRLATLIDHVNTAKARLFFERESA